jgi:hypothetical protein
MLLEELTIPERTAEYFNVVGVNQHKLRNIAEDIIIKTFSIINNIFFYLIILSNVYINILLPFIILRFILFLYCLYLLIVLIYVYVWD